MEHVDGGLIFSASDLINYLECPHLTDLNIEVALGREDFEPSRSDTTNLVARKGDEHERAHLDRLAGEGREIVRIESEPGLEGTRRGARESARLTLAVMGPFKKRPRPPSVKFAETDGLGRLIQGAIDELEAARALRPDCPVSDDSPRYEGYCARACEAYVFLMRDERTSGFARNKDAEAKYVKWGRERGESHYFLEGSAGVMDLNFGPDDPPDWDYCEYEDGKPPRNQGFRPWKEDPRY